MLRSRIHAVIVASMLGTAFLWLCGGCDALRNATDSSTTEASQPSE